MKGGMKGKRTNWKKGWGFGSLGKMIVMARTNPRQETNANAVAKIGSSNQSVQPAPEKKAAYENLEGTKPHKMSEGGGGGRPRPECLNIKLRGEVVCKKKSARQHLR